MAKPNYSLYAILGLLSYEPMSGYGIKMSVDKGVGYFWEIDYKQIYPALKKMEQDGLVTFTLDKDGKGPTSKVYQITEKGLDKLKEWLDQPIAPGIHSDKELKLKLFFGHHLTVDRMIAHIQSYKEMHIDHLAELAPIKKSVFNEDYSESKHYRMTTIMYGEILYKGSIEWCDKAIAYLRESIQTK